MTKLFSSHRAVTWLFILCSFIGCITAGNLGVLSFVPSNLSKKCINSYSQGIVEEFKVPDSLRYLTWNYEHINITNLYFSSPPRSIYRVILYPTARIVSVYDLERSLELTRESQIEEDEINEIVSRFQNSILKPIWDRARLDGMKDTVMYIFPEHKNFTY